MPIALITGASTGIGYELSKLFANDHYDLILVARDEAKLRQVADELGAVSGRTVRVIAADLSRWTSPQEVKDATQGAIVDVLVNNAGFGLGGAFAQTDLNVELGMMQVNMVSLVHLTKLFLPMMLAQRNGRILNVASTAAFQPGPLMAIYFATKAFVLSFSEAISEELIGSGVTVTALCPGPTQSEFQKRAKLDKTRLFKGGMLSIMSSAEVARIGFEAMMKGEPLVIAGWKNKVGVQALRISPRAIVRRITKRLQESGDTH